MKKLIFTFTFLLCASASICAQDRTTTELRLCQDPQTGRMTQQTCAINLGLLIQDRQLAELRPAVRFTPTLFEMPNGIAAGIAQYPQGYALPLSDTPVPSGSIVGIYGLSLTVNQTDSLVLWNEEKKTGIVVPVEIWPYWFGMEIVTFRLPPDVHGEVKVWIAGRLASNRVRLVVE